MNVKPHLITVIRSGVEAATQWMDYAKQAFNPVAELRIKFVGNLDFARYDAWALKLNCA